MQSTRVDDRLDELGVDHAPTVVEDTQAQEFGRYQLLYQLGIGGMATIFLGRLRGPGGFDRPVAIKRIHAHLAEEKSFVDMFLDEAQIIARINHPNVCSVHDFGEIGGVYYLAMEYLVGEPLSSILRSVSMRPDELGSRRWHAFACRLVADACEGLHAAHELRDDQKRRLDVVHRDVSPQNLFVTYDGALKVVDFGIASARNRLHATAGGAIKGKLAYVAPELFGGARADRRADVWALGIVLWETLVGQRLFKKRTDAETMIAVRQGPITPPSRANPSLDPKLDPIVLRALARDPEQRYQTARELGHELTTYLATCGERAGLADLAEWMQRTFKQEHSKKLELLEEVSGRDSIDEQNTAVREIPAARAEAGVVPESETATSPVLPEREAETQPHVRSPSEPSVERDTVPPPAPARKKKSSMPWLAIAAVIALLGASAAGWFLVYVPWSMRAASDRAPGTVTVITTGGWADVYYDGARLGRTPRDITMPGGQQEILLYPAGQPPPRRVPVEVPPNGTVRVVVPL